MADLVSVADAAKRLTAAGDKIDRSGLSHYLKRHATALPTTKPSGRLTLVDYDALTAHRRAHLGKDLAVKGSAAAGLCRADELQGKLRADRLLAVDRLTKRKAALVPTVTAEWCASEACLAMDHAVRTAAAETAAIISAERGGNVAPVEAVLIEQGAQASAAMEATLRKAGFLARTIARLHELAALVPPPEAEPPEPQNLDDERAAKARMDRLRQELTLCHKRDVLMSLHEARFAFVDAVETAKQALDTAARDGAEALARAAGVEPVFLRSYPRQHKRRVLTLWTAQMRARMESRT